MKNAPGEPLDRRPVRRPTRQAALPVRGMLGLLLKPPGCLWTVAGALFGVLLAVAGALTGPLARAGLHPDGPLLVVTILPAPTSTPLEATALHPEVPTAPASTATATADLGSELHFSAGELVEVTGTGEDGLRLRSSPSLEGTIRFLGVDSEVFEVQAGPEQADGYVWWYLVNPYDSSKQGWAVSKYLVSLRSP